MDHGFDRGRYLDVLYPFQDSVLGAISSVDTGFYLTGGTAASRGYLNHRFSDDLDLFVNDDPRFEFWADRIVQALAAKPEWVVTVTLKETRFVRLVVASEVDLKLELVSDVPSHTGEIRDHPRLGRLDSAENILANKLTALSAREEPKDLADVWGFCSRLGLPIPRALGHAHSKAAGLFPADLARVLLSAQRSDWELVRWIEAPEPNQYVETLHRLGEELLLLK